MVTSEEFQTAAEECKKLKSPPSNDQLLDLYALYKIGSGEDISKAPAPGMFAVKEKYKREAWQKRVDEGITTEKAQEMYVKLVEELKKRGRMR